MALPEGAAFKPYSYDQDGYTIVERPPLKSDVPLPRDTPEDIEMDGAPGFAANAIQFDFVRDTFSRQRNAPHSDPPKELMQRVLDSFIARMRYVARAAHVEPFDLVQESYWSLEYLNDDGSELPDDPALRKRLGGRHWKFSLVGITPAIWDRMHELPADWKTPVWDDILLDAANALPRIGTAATLGATALEVFVADVLDRVALTGDIPSDVWQWIHKRESFLQAPSTEEEFDALLKHFTGHSLKENMTLWESFKNLRTARNKFVHEGHATIGGIAVDRNKATELLDNAGRIIDLVRGWIPSQHQWIVFNEKVDFRFGTRLFAAAETPSAPTGEDEAIAQS
jgi:hypothetical protein